MATLADEAAPHRAGPLRRRRPPNRLPGMALATLDPALPDREDTANGAPLAEARSCEGCGGSLTQAQRAKGARHCAPRCRVRAHAARRKATKLAAADAGIASVEQQLVTLDQQRAEMTSALRVLRALRQEIAR